MQIKQSSVKICEVNITSEDEFISFFDTNYSLFKDHLIVISGDVSTEIEKYLKIKGLKYIINVELPAKSKNRATPQKEVQNHFTVLDRLVRSGSELKIKGDLLLLNRVNSGATIIIDGNLIITQVVDGSIRCNGNFMMLKASTKANIVFHNVEVDNSFLQERLNRVELKDNEILITPVLKETNWV